MDYRDTDRTSHCIGGSMSTVDLRGRFWTSPTVTFLAVSMQSYTRLIHDLFSNNEQGFVYDPNDLSTMFQDAAGTTPVTAAGQPVGLVLDKSKGMVLGSNVATGFTSGFIFGNSVAADLVNNPTGAVSSNWFPVTPSAFYKIQAPISNRCRVQVKNASGVITYLTAFSSETSANARLVAALSDSILMRIYFANEAIGSQVTAFEARKLTGNHAYQTTSDSRPILHQTPILGSELVTTNLMNGKPATGSTQFYNMAGRMPLLSAGKTYIISYTVKDYAGTGAVGLAGAAPVGVVQNNHNANGMYSSIQTPTANGYFVFYTSATNTANFSDISVKEVTGYGTDQNYLEFDGADDFLQTNNIDFSATDKVSLFAGVRKLSDAATGMVCELSTSADTSKSAFVLFAPAANGSNHYNFRSFGTTGAASGTPHVTNFPAPHSAVLRATGAISTNTCELVINGGSKQSANTNQGTGNYGNYPLYIGRRGGATLPFNGHIYSLIGVGRLATDAETIALEKEVAKRTGVTLSV